MSGCDAPQRVGILSDTHGRVPSCRRAVTALRAAGADLLLHLGDVGSEAVLEELVGDVPVRVVFGNCDDERALAAYAAHLGLGVDHPIGRFSASGWRFGFTHGHLGDLVTEAADTIDVLFVGHSHRLAADRVGRMRVINPGAPLRADRYTAAIVEIDAGDVRVSWMDVGRD